jgi:hypothetical protein
MKVKAIGFAFREGISDRRQASCGPAALFQNTKAKPEARAPHCPFGASSMRCGLFGQLVD